MSVQPKPNRQHRMHGLMPRFGDVLFTSFGGAKWSACSTWQKPEWTTEMTEDPALVTCEQCMRRLALDTVERLSGNIAVPTDGSDLTIKWANR